MHGSIDRPKTCFARCWRPTQKLQTTSMRESCCLTAADRRHNRNFHSGNDSRCKSTGVTNVFVCHKNIHVPSRLPRLGENPITQSRVCGEQRLQSFKQRNARFHLDLNCALLLGELAQRPGYMKRNLHQRDFFCFSLFITDFFFLAGLDCCVVIRAVETPSICTTAALTHKICGNPSTILFQVFPSSRDPYNFP